MTLKPFLNRGESLIEVLVTLLILSIGLLGYAKATLSALRVTDESYQNSYKVVQQNNEQEQIVK